MSAVCAFYIFVNIGRIEYLSVVFNKIKLTVYRFSRFLGSENETGSEYLCVGTCSESASAECVKRCFGSGQHRIFKTDSAAQKKVDCIVSAYGHTLEVDYVLSFFVELAYSLYCFVNRVSDCSFNRFGNFFAVCGYLLAVFEADIVRCLVDIA